MFLQQFAKPLASFGFFPPIKIFRKRSSGNGQDVGMEQSQGAQVQHDFRDTAGQKYADGWMMDRAVGQYADQSGNAAVHSDPVVDSRRLQSGGMRDGGDMQQEIGRTAEGGVQN